MALAADFNYATKNTEIVNAKSNVADTYYQGAMVMWNTDGYAAVCADTASCVPIGVVKKQVIVGAGEIKDMEVETGVLRIAHTGAAQTDVGAFLYATADDTLADTASNVGPFGLCVDWEAGYLWIDTRIKALS